MNLEKMICMLNDDLGNEYSHWHFYLNAATRVVGLDRQEIQEYLLAEAAGEMKHVEEFKRLIIGLGGVPSTTVASFQDGLTDTHQILVEALRMEDEVVHNYVHRIDDACELQSNGGIDKIHGKYIELFLEEQILASRADADHIREIVK